MLGLTSVIWLLADSGKLQRLANLGSQQGCMHTTELKNSTDSVVLGDKNLLRGNMIISLKMPQRQAENIQVASS